MAVFTIAALSPNDMSDGDAALTLVAAQAWCDHGSFDLSPFERDPRFRYDLEDDYRVRRRPDGVFYYNIGPPMAMVPVVVIARSLGLDMVELDDEKTTQNLVSAVLCGLTFGLVYLLLRIFVSDRAALVIALISVLGSPLISTSATALWSQSIALPLMSAALLATVRCDPEAGSAGRFTLPRLLAVPPLLLAAFFCRPTAGFLTLGVLTWLAYRLRVLCLDRSRHGDCIPPPDEIDLEPAPGWRRRRLPILAVLIAAAALAIIALVWLLPHLPHYYQPSRLRPRTSPFFGLYAVLLSPSRGLLVFCPFLVVVLAGLATTGRRLANRPLLALAAVWSVSHLAALSVRSTWWGGHSFGPRLAAEVILAALIPTAVVWRSLAPSSGGDTHSRVRARRWGVTAYLVTGAIAVAIHTGQGLFNPNVQRWNHLPDIDRHQELLMTWRHPQFLATERRLDDRGVDIQRRRLEPYSWGDRISADGSNAVFAGWYQPEGTRRWSRGHTAGLEILLPQAPVADNFRLTVHAAGLETQHISIRCNQKEIGTLTLSHPPRDHVLQLAAEHLIFGEINRLQFDIPDAHRPDNGDPRVLGIDYHWCRITPGLP